MPDEDHPGPGDQVADGSENSAGEVCGDGADDGRSSMLADSELLGAPASPARLMALQSAGLPDAAYGRSVEIALESPPADEWRRFAELAFLGAGTGLVLAGAVYFFAFNWARLGPYSQFVLVQLGIVLAFIIAWRYGLDRLEGQVAVSAAAVLSGVLLAVIGQTYQTGADRWTLFALWAILAMPWALAARFTPLWLMELALANVALGIWVVDRPWWMRVESAVGALIMVFAFNAAVLVIWETLAPVGNRWMPRITATAALAALAAANIAWIVSGSWFRSELAWPWAPPLAAVLSIVALVAVPAFYGRRRKDLYMEAALAAATIAVVTTGIGHLLFDVWDTNYLGLLLLGVAVLAQAVVAAVWLRNESRHAGDGTPSW